MKLYHKYKAVRSECDGIKFASKREKSRYLELKLLQQKGEVVFFLRQIPFYLAGGVKYVCDFLVFWNEGDVTFEDVKGMKTPVYIAKKKMVESLYPVRIEEV